MKSGWVTKRLGEVCESKIARLKTLKVDTIKYIDISSVDRATKSVSGVTEYAVKDAPGRAQQVVYPDDLLVSTVRPNLNTVALVPGDIIGTPIASTGFSVLRANDLTCPRWLYYYSQTSKFIDPLVADSEKAAYPSVTDSRVREVEIPIPPLPEQRRIVAKIDAAFAKIDRLKANAEKNRTNAKELFQSALNEAMRPKPGWVEKRLGEVCVLKSGNSKANGSPAGDLPYVKVGDMTFPGNEEQITTSSRFVDRAFNARDIFPKGAVIFPKRGGAIFTNKKRITAVEICCDLNVMGVWPRDRLLESRYLYYYFIGLDFAEICDGAAIPQLNNCDIAPLTLALPPIDAQTKIAQGLDVLSNSCATLQSNYTRLIADCAEMRQAVLKEAFEGKL